MWVDSDNASCSLWITMKKWELHSIYSNQPLSPIPPFFPHATRIWYLLQFSYWPRHPNHGLWGSTNLIPNKFQYLDWNWGSVFSHSPEIGHVWTKSLWTLGDIERWWHKRGRSSRCRWQYSGQTRVCRIMSLGPALCETNYCSVVWINTTSSSRQTSLYCFLNGSVAAESAVQTKHSWPVRQERLRTDSFFHCSFGTVSCKAPPQKTCPSDVKEPDNWSQVF